MHEQWLAAMEQSQDSGLPQQSQGDSLGRLLHCHGQLSALLVALYTGATAPVCEPGVACVGGLGLEKEARPQGTGARSSRS